MAESKVSNLGEVQRNPGLKTRRPTT